jgi:hypothetical protein
VELNEAQIALLQLLTNEGTYIYHDIVSSQVTLVRPGEEDFPLRRETFKKLKDAGLIERRVSLSNKYIISRKGREAIS